MKPEMRQKMIDSEISDSTISEVISYLCNYDPEDEGKTSAKHFTLSAETSDNILKVVISLDEGAVYEFSYVIEGSVIFQNLQNPSAEEAYVSYYIFSIILDAIASSLGLDGALSHINLEDEPPKGVRVEKTDDSVSFSVDLAKLKEGA